MKILRWLRSKEGITAVIVPFVTMIIGSIISLYAVEIRNMIGISLIRVSIFLMWAGAVILVTGYIRKFIWKSTSNSVELTGQQQQIDNLNTILIEHIKYASTTNQALVAFINEMPNDEIKRMADTFLKNQINIDDLEKIGIRSAIITLLRAKYHEFEAIKHNAVISFE